MILISFAVSVFEGSAGGKSKILGNLAVCAATLLACSVIDVALGVACCWKNTALLNLLLYAVPYLPPTFWKMDIL
jgi:hypothetical protein